MKYEEYLLKILYAPYFSEKSSTLTSKYDTIVLKVAKNANKLDIKLAVQKIFAVAVYDVRTLIVKGKTKLRKGCMVRRSNWKKAYVTLKKGEKVSFLNK